MLFKIISIKLSIFQPTGSEALTSAVIIEQPHVCCKEIIVFFSIKDPQLFINGLKISIKDLTGDTYRERFKAITFS